MSRYIIRRLLGLIPVFFGITIVLFCVIHLAPGKPIDQTAMSQKVTYEAKLKLQKLYGLDKPLHIQYFEWLGRLLRFDFGKSYVDGRGVLTKIAERLPITLFINALSLTLILTIGIPIGIISALKKNSLIDKLSTVTVFAGFSIPEFWLSLLAMSLFGITLGWLPVSGLKSIDFEYMTLGGKVVDIMRHLILPVTIASFGGLAGISRYMRTSMIGILSQDYIRTARAKGMPETSVVCKHALKNAILPVITIVGLSIPGLIGGSVIFESIFAIPGMGRLFYESVMARDYPTIMGVLSIGAMLTLAGNLLADIAYSYADPRIRITEHE